MPYTIGHRPYAKEGVTIIELVMVIVMISILAVLAIPRVDTFYAMKLEGTVKKVVSDIRYTQQLALARHENYKIIFNAGNDSYVVQRAADNSYATDPFTRTNMQINLSSDPQFGGVNIATTNLASGTLQFNWEGIPQDATGAALSEQGSVQLDYHGNSKTIYITPDTGRVRVE